MSIYSLSLLLVTIFSVYLGCSVYYRNKGNAINRIFFIYALLGAYLSFAQFMISGSGDSASVLFWLRAWFPWPFVPVILFRFILATTNGFYKAFNRFVFKLAVLLALIVSVLYVTTNLMIGTLAMTTIGWYHKAPSHWLFYFYSLLTLALAFYSVFLIVSVYIRSTQKIKRQQYVLILVSVLIAPVLSIINYLILTIYGIRIPGLYSYSLALGLIFIWVGIEKFRIFPGGFIC